MTWRSDPRAVESNRRILSENIAKDPVGRRLTPQAHERAVDFALKNWPANTGNGAAAQLGIKHVTSDVFK